MGVAALSASATAAISTEGSELERKCFPISRDAFYSAESRIQRREIEMKISLREFFCAAAMGVFALGVQAQATPDATGATTPKMTGDSTTKMQADADYKAAKDACNAKSASEKAACLRDARSAHDRAMQGKQAGQGDTGSSSGLGSQASGTPSSGTPGAAGAPGAGGASTGSTGSASGTGGQGAGGTAGTTGSTGAGTGGTSGTGGGASTGGAAK